MYFVVKNTAVQYPSNVQWCRLIWAILRSLDFRT